MEAQVHILTANLLHREVEIAKFLVAIANSVAQAVEKFDHFAVMHDRKLARMGQNEVRQSPLKSFKILIDLCLMWLGHSSGPHAKLYLRP